MEETRKRILITGHAGNFGRAADAYFTAQGWETVGVSRRVGIDLNNWRQTGAFIISQPPFDIVLMAHGTQKQVLVKDFDEYTWELVLENNLKSAAILSNILVRYKRLNQGALVVYSSSIQATQPRAGRGLYAMAKNGLEALARIMAVELAPEGRAVALRLGQMTRTMDGVVFSPEAEAAIKAYTPLPWVDFTDAARFVLNLYEQPSLSGETIEISSMHKFSVWPK